MANVLTAGRIVLALALLFLRPGGIPFAAVYLLGGLTDLLDGPLARRTGTVSAFGAKLDTLADICFFVCAAARLVPYLQIPPRLFGWAAGIAGVKLFNILCGLLLHGSFPAVHTLTNKIAGGLLFFFPLAVPFAGVTLGGTVLCAFSTFAALWEGMTVLSGREKL